MEDPTSAVATSWTEARALGVAFYTTGRPCKHGHIAARYARSGECVECARLRTLRADPEAVRVRQAKWRARHPEQARAITANWRAKNPEKAKQQIAKWRAENPLRVREHAARVTAKNPQKNRDRVKAWVAANPEKHRANGRNRRARERGAEGSHTASEIHDLYVRQGGRCVYCRVELGNKAQGDHIQPLALGGSNWISNIQLLCKTCNSRKHAKDPARFARELGLPW